MKLHVLTVGKPKSAACTAGVRDYAQRLERYGGVAFLVAAGEDLAPRATAGAVGVALAKEGEKILARVPAGAFVVALDREGRALSSDELAAELRRWQQSQRAVVFVIGSAHGLDRQVLQRAGLRLSLSRLTLPHELALLVLLEQIYRAHSILRGEPYHKPNHE